MPATAVAASKREEVSVSSLPTNRIKDVRLANLQLSSQYECGFSCQGAKTAETPLK
jgi:hypothetical protein